MRSSGIVAALAFVAVALGAGGAVQAELLWDGSGDLFTPFPDSYNITSNTYRSDHFFGAPNTGGFLSSIGSAGGMLGNSSLGITKAAGWQIEFGWAAIGAGVPLGLDTFISMGDDVNNIQMKFDAPGGDASDGTVQLQSNGATIATSSIATGVQFTQSVRSEDPSEFRVFTLQRLAESDTVTLSIDGSQVIAFNPVPCALPNCDGGNLNNFYIGPSRSEGTFDFLNVYDELIPEPASIGLLVLGGLAMLRRRR